jgi:DNA-directed RNA polymerase subunit K/omega
MIQYPDDLESKFKFVTLASLRCEQLQKGAKARLTSKSSKHTTVAQEEVLAGEVIQMTEEEIAEAQATAMASPLEPEQTEEIVESRG